MVKKTVYIVRGKYPAFSTEHFSDFNRSSPLRRICIKICKQAENKEGGTAKETKEV
jgi:hypothetical protein